MKEKTMLEERLDLLNSRYYIQIVIEADKGVENLTAEKYNAICRKRCSGNT